MLVAGLGVAGCSNGAEDTRGGTPPVTENQRGNPEFKDSDAKVRDHVIAMGKCLAEAGFPNEMQEDGGLEIDDGPQEQAGAFEAAAKACREQLPEPPGADGLTAEEVGVLYDLQIDAGTCLEQAGYPVAEMASRDTFVAQYLAVQNTDAQVPSPVTPWDPIRGRASQQAQEVCKYPTPQDIYERMNQP